MFKRLFSTTQQPAIPANREVHVFRVLESSQSSGSPANKRKVPDQYDVDLEDMHGLKSSTSSSPLFSAQSGSKQQDSVDEDKNMVDFSPHGRTTSLVGSVPVAEFR